MIRVRVIVELDNDRTEIDCSPPHPVTVGQAADLARAALGRAVSDAQRWISMRDDAPMPAEEATR